MGRDVGSRRGLRWGVYSVGKGDRPYPTSSKCGEVRSPHVAHKSFKNSDTAVAGAPVPQREPGTLTTAVKSPDHYPSWEVVAEMLYE
jgi:hypothetical protein